jgi:hypothetical protein
MESPFLTIKEAAKYIRHSEAALRQIVQRSKYFIDAGKEPELKFAQGRKGGRILFRKEWLDEYLAPAEPKTPVVKVPRAKPYRGTPIGSHGF